MSKLKHTEGRIIVSVDIEAKNYHTFAGGIVIRRERQFDNLNRRETEPVNGFVISAKYIPEGSEVLIHHNGVTESNRIYNYKKLSGEETSSDVKYYSILEDQCFFWREDEEWIPIAPYETALRVFEPYKGFMVGIDPKIIPNILYCTSGRLKGKALLTVKASDYEVVFQDIDGREGRMIRFRPDGQKGKREPEAIAIMEALTKKINKGELLIGLSATNCKPLEERELIHRN